MKTSSYGLVLLLAPLLRAAPLNPRMITKRGEEAPESKQYSRFRSTTLTPRTAWIYTQPDAVEKRGEEAPESREVLRLPTVQC